MTAAITIENLSKKFSIRQRKTGSSYVSLREVLANKAKRLLTPTAPRNIATEAQDFWALQDINLTVEQGDKLAIIGNNGAGKSTLLKILSQITEPSAGRVTIQGRVASLLEVGTGFHPELTGRENIFLNGSILGMSHGEIKRKFDEIVDFAGVETFLDTPVKRYSSGMRLRLGFAVAAHLESEILIIDEVLAVGDAAFQKKCFGKMDEISRNEGRTILFVSHNIGAVQQLCTKGVVLSHGKVVHSGSLASSINVYFDSMSVDGSQSEWHGDVSLPASYNHTHLRLRSIRIEDEAGQILMAPATNDAPPRLVFEIERLTPTAELGYLLYNRFGTVIYASSTVDAGEAANPLGSGETGHVRLATRIPARLLNEGVYTIAPFAYLRNDECFMHPKRERDLPRLSFEISGGMSDTDLFTKAREGELAPILGWEKAPHQTTP